MKRVSIYVEEIGELAGQAADDIVSMAERRCEIDLSYVRDQIKDEVMHVIATWSEPLD